MRSSKRPESPNVGDDGPEVPPVLLPDSGDSPGIIPGARNVLLTLGALVVLGGAVGLVMGSVDSPDAAAEPLGPAEPFVPGEVSARPAPYGGPDTAFEGALDSLRSALDRYRQRQIDFERGRLDCDGLTSGYDRVSRGVVEIARVRRSARGPAAAAAAAFDSVMDDAAAVDRRFDESGCPRP